MPCDCQAKPRQFYIPDIFVLGTGGDVDMMGTFVSTQNRFTFVSWNSWERVEM